MEKVNPAIKEKLDYLSNLAKTDYPFISLYMNINAHELFEQNRQNAIFIKDSFNKYLDKLKNDKDKDKVKSFIKDKDKIQYFLNFELDTRAHGVAVFACDKLGVFETFQSIMPFDNSFTVNSIPYLKQMVYQALIDKNALVIMLDSNHSRIFKIKLGGQIFSGNSFDEFDETGQIHRFHSQGGWAQSRYQRHIENEKEHHYKEVVKIVTQFLDEEQYDNIILMGEGSEIKNFRDLLPKRVEMKIIALDSMQMRENVNEIFYTIINNFRETEKENEFQMVQDLIGATKGGSLGIQDTIQLAKEGRIRTLAIVKDMEIKGFKCGECFYLSKDQYQPGCPKCNGNTRPTDLIEEAILLTVKNGGNVEVVENKAATELKKREGIGAYLRY